MRKSTNYELNLLDEDDFYNEELFNENMEIIDDELEKINEHITDIKASETTNEQIQEALRIIQNTNDDLDSVKRNVLNLAMAVSSLIDADVIDSENIVVELFDTQDDIKLTSGYYDAENKRLYA